MNSYGQIPRLSIQNAGMHQHPPQHLRGYSKSTDHLGAQVRWGEGRRIQTEFMLLVLNEDHRAVWDV